MVSDLSRRVEKLEKDTDEKSIRIVWLNPGQKPEAPRPDKSERVLNVSWQWSGGDAA
jgi:hypothetical protein